MSSESIIPLFFSSLLSEKGFTVDDVLYELFSNALDANLEQGVEEPPQIYHKDGKIIIEDKGCGLSKDNLTYVGRLTPVRADRNGSHGIGLKDAIAYCVTNSHLLEIFSNGKSYTFRKVNPSEQKLEAVCCDCEHHEGTKISISVPNGASLLEKIKNKFLCLQSSLTMKCQTDSIAVYHATKGEFYVLGVRKVCPYPLKYTYNILKLKPEQKDCIERNHSIKGKRFRQYFEKQIRGICSDETFGGVFEAVAASTVSSPRMHVTVDAAISHFIGEHCMTQDYPVWTSTTAEREALQCAKRSVIEILHRITDVSVAKCQERGSLAKNTFVPGVSDIDIVVEVNGRNDDTRRAIANRIKDKLREEGARLEDSGSNIVNCTFENVAFDIVLMETGSDRYERIRLAPEKSRLKLHSFIRAMKYWKLRAGVSIKSCVIEEVVLLLWPKLMASTAKDAFKLFLSNAARESRGEIKDFYDLTEESLDNLESAAQATLRLLE